MDTIGAFSHLLGILYSATLEDQRWEDFLASLSRCTNSAVGVFLSADQRLGMSCRAQGGNGPEQRVDALAYNQRYVGTDPFRTPCLRDPRPRIVEGDDLLPHHGLLGTELYRDLLAPHGFRYATLLLLTLSLRRIEIVTLWRTHAQGPMDPESHRLLSLVFPHIQKALQIRQVLGVSVQKAAQFKTLADSSSTPSFLLRGTGQLVEANQAGRRLLEKQNPLCLVNGCLSALSPASQKPLRRLIGSVRLPFSPRERPDAQAVLLDGRHGESFQVFASPIPLSRENVTQAEVLLLIGDPTPVHHPDTALQMLYKLTPAEIEIANGLLMGYTTGEIASLRHVTPGTVRLQVKTILGKTGASRQSDLVRLLMTLPHPPA